MSAHSGHEFNFGLAIADCGFWGMGSTAASAVGFGASPNPFLPSDVSSGALETAREGACAPLSRRAALPVCGFAMDHS